MMLSQLLTGQLEYSIWAKKRVITILCQRQISHGQENSPYGSDRQHQKLYKKCCLGNIQKSELQTIAIKLLEAEYDVQFPVLTVCCIKTRDQLYHVFKDTIHQSQMCCSSSCWASDVTEVKLRGIMTLQTITT